ncbi:hypothetical protein P1P75_29440, partial [Streptomyces sp. ID05-39B]|uniref:hypothetical protein n=1 Tax=Streptomyces sp. ID05-39B TaxID=3028664 RepID=UPI0029B486A2
LRPAVAAGLDVREWRRRFGRGAGLLRVLSGRLGRGDGRRGQSLTAAVDVAGLMGAFSWTAGL